MISFSETVLWSLLGRNDYEIKEFFKTEDKNVITILKDIEHTPDVNLQDVGNSNSRQVKTEQSQDRITCNRTSKESSDKDKHGSAKIEEDSVPRVTRKNLLEHPSFANLKFNRTRKPDGSCDYTLKNLL